MLRLIQVIRWLTWLVLAAGVFGLYQLYRPMTALATWEILRDVVVAGMAQSTVWIVAAASVLLSFLARRLELRPIYLDPDASKVHRVDAPPSPFEQEAAGQLTELPEGLRRRREQDQRRLRLEAFLRGTPDVVRFVDEVLATAVAAGASDIHVQPLAGSTRVSFRLRGVLEEVAEVPAALHPTVIRRIKVLSNLVSYAQDRPQDGRMSISAPDGEAELRVSTMPTHHGEKAVLRLAGSAAMLDLADLGMATAELEAFDALLREPQGMIVLTGPTGSGKTSTLYSALAHIHRQRGDTVTIASIEDPIEVDLPFMNQTQVDRARGLEFAEALRALLRQDPNVLMVGEIRDRETAKIAVQAALTGHLVLTTLHADSTIGIFPRLIDLEVEPFLAASSTLACISQRLVRTLCPQCRRPQRPTASDLQRLSALDAEVDASLTQIAEGCRECGHSGVTGRSAIFELLTVTPEIRRLVTANRPPDEIYALARQGGTQRLLDGGLARVHAGDVALSEVLRVTR